MIAGATFEQDSPPEGDFAFAGVKMRVHPSQVPPGFCAAARNQRFTDGRAATRKGVWLLPWTNKVASPTIEPFDVIHGTSVFSDPNSKQWILQAADGGVYRMREGNGARAVSLPAGVTLADDVEFLQAFNSVLMFRGVDLPPLVMSSLGVGFRPMSVLGNDPAASAQNPDDGTEPIPNAEFGLFMQNRVFVPYGKDYVAASDYLNFTRYQPVLSAFRVNVGDDQRITGLHEFNENTMLVFKNRSVHLVTGVYGDLSALQRTTVTDEYGCVSRKSIITVGKDVWFMAARRGVCSIAQTVQGKVQGVDIPASQDIQPLIDRINWRLAHLIKAKLVGNFSYWAVPLDDAKATGLRVSAELTLDEGSAAAPDLVPGRLYRWMPQRADEFITVGLTLLGDPASVDLYPNANLDPVEFTAPPSGKWVFRYYANPSGMETVAYAPVNTDVCNAVLVYDHLNQAWAGHDDGDVIQVRDWLRAEYLGAERLFIVTETGFIGLYEEIARDQISAESFMEIEGSVTTRGYALRSKLGRIRAREVDLQVRTWNPTYSLTATLDGAYESQRVATPATRDRSLYYRPFDAPAWDVTNVNDDHATPHRQDYSAPIGTDDVRFHLGTGDGVDFSAMQETTDTYHVPPGVRGQSVQFTLASTQGRVELCGVVMDKLNVDPMKGVKS